MITPGYSNVPIMLGATQIANMVLPKRETMDAETIALLRAKIMAAFEAQYAEPPSAGPVSGEGAI